MNKQELIDYCESLKGDLNKFINGIDVNKIVKKIEQLDEPQKPVVPQSVAEWIKKGKKELSLRDLMSSSYTSTEVGNWLEELDEDGGFKNQETFARAVLDGYEIEEEKRYLVKIIGITNYNSYLNYHKRENKWTIESCAETDVIRTKHTHKELEEAGFGWVFNCPGIEIEEVE